MTSCTGMLEEDSYLIKKVHELRHLVYECNEILEIGSEKYPEDGYLEDNVEDYGNAYAEKVYRKYRNMFLNMR